MNKISSQVYTLAADKSIPRTPCDGRGVFIPELLDIICPNKTYDPTSCPSSNAQQASLNTMHSSEIFDMNTPYLQDQFEVKTGDSESINLNEICLVMEYIESDIDQILKHHIEFDCNHLLKIVYNTLCCLSFLHECNVMHRDIKCANILLTSNCNAKICDFGLSRTLPQPIMDLKGFNTLHLREFVLSKYKLNGRNQEHLIRN